VKKSSVNSLLKHNKKYWSTYEYTSGLPYSRLYALSFKKNLLSGLDVDWILDLPEHLFKFVGLLTE
jgi:hypothetical protein